ncbi:MAG: hypothetical protein ACXAEU_06090 [Candidatus Hodarchaeales archaeon]|jgi:hypothetical protein
MVDKPKFVVVLEWDTDQRDFIQVDQPNEVSIYAIIDEEQEKVFLNFTDNASLITRRTVERRIRSIAKSGFEVANQRIRVGMNFKVVETGSDTNVPDILLQVGHQYVGLDKKAESSKSKRKKATKPEKIVIETTARAQESEEPTPLPPPRAPIKRRKRHMVKPTFSGSPIKRKAVKSSTPASTTDSEEPVESEITPQVANHKEMTVMARNTSHKEVDLITLGLGAMVRTFIEDTDSICITKKGDSNFLIETGSSLVEFRLIEGLPEYLRSLRSTKKSIKIKELEKQLKKYL